MEALCKSHACTYVRAPLRMPLLAHTYMQAHTNQPSSQPTLSLATHKSAIIMDCSVISSRE